MMIAANDDHLKRRGTYLVNRIRSGAGNRRQPRIGAPDPVLTPNAGLAAITELCDRLGVISALDTAVGPIKQRERGFGSERWTAHTVQDRTRSSGCRRVRVRR